MKIDACDPWVQEAGAGSGARRRWARRALLGAVLAGATASAGCYTYEPVSGEPTPLPADVRLHLDADSLPIATERGGTVRGRLLNWEAEEAVLVWYGDPEGSPYAARREQTVRIPRDEIASVDMKRIDKQRTGLLIGTAVALTAISVVTLFEGEAAGGSPNPGPPGDVSIISISTPPISVPLLRW